MNSFLPRVKNKQLMGLLLHINRQRYLLYIAIIKKRKDKKTSLMGCLRICLNLCLFTSEGAKKRVKDCYRHKH